MSSSIRVYIDAEDKPTDFPSHKTIIKKSKEMRHARSRETESNVSGVKLPLEPETSGSGSHDDEDELRIRYIWVKFRYNVRMGEARTQQYVSQYLGGNDTVRAPHVYAAFTRGTCGYIVSEYIDGRICDDSDIPCNPSSKSRALKTKRCLGPSVGASSSILGSTSPLSGTKVSKN